MRFLIDTHAAIWFITEDKQLPQGLKSLIADASNECFVSIASLWEIGIKHSLGKLDLKSDLKRIFELIDETGFTLLPITTKHILTNAILDFHHRDPFDRLIIAQAKSERLTLISKDEAFKDYDINWIWSS